MDRNRRSKMKRCCLFSYNTAEEAMAQKPFKRIEVFGNKQLNPDGTVKHWLHSGENGERMLVKCKKCGALFLWQSSYMTWRNDTVYHELILPVENRETALEYNEKYNGWFLESNYCGLYIWETSKGWVWNKDSKSFDMKEAIYGGIIGLCVGDALGLPVQFNKREKLKQKPVIDMIGNGTYNLPAGTWSDDSSMTLCLMDSLSNGLDYDDIMRKFQAWLVDGEYTPYGKSFDVGTTTLQSILLSIKRGSNITQCGGTGEYSNGNGSLMRILPTVFYYRKKHKFSIHDNHEALGIIHNISSLTHAHKRSFLACGIFCIIAENLIYNYGIKKGIQYGLKSAKKYYESIPEFADECIHYERLFSGSIFTLPETEIHSSGYVVDTLEAALWCLMKTRSYKTCVLKAVNLGGDTDTIAAVAGGLAGIHYGLDAIPDKWLSQIARLDYIKELCKTFYNSLSEGKRIGL